MPNHPLLVWELTNTTGYALEQGPVTIIDKGYVGEGLMRFAGVGDNIQIPYALEFGILITEDVKRSKSTLFGIEIDGERKQITLRRSHITTHIYTFTSRVERDMTILIERRDPVRDVYDAMPDPVFAGAGHTRWAVDVLGNTITTFPVHVRTLTDSREDVSKWNADFIEELNGQDFLSEALYVLLQSFLEVRQRKMDAVEETKALYTEQESIQKLQEQLRKNLGALGSSDREVTIRNQLLTDLENSENRRRLITTRISELDQQADQASLLQESILNDIYASG